VKLARLALVVLFLGCVPFPQLVSNEVVAEPPVPTVNVPYFPGDSDDIRWIEAGIFWFGRVELAPDCTPPGKSYVDVRVAYTDRELVVYANVVDYFVWYNEAATPQSDLTQYDAVAVYVDTAGGGALSPQVHDRYFLSGLCMYNCGDGANYRREAIGTGQGWDAAWTADWRAASWASWSWFPGSGPNSNYSPIGEDACNYKDFGWWSYLHLPWAAFGLDGRPDPGEVWGLGMVLHDRDDRPPQGAVEPQSWPDGFSAGNPSTWARLEFGLSPYTAPSAIAEGTTVIRRGLPGSVVEDAWVGGGGGCSGGHEGDPDGDNHGDDTSLYVANQELIADFPCFSKTYLRFGLDGIPDGKVIISATLTLHLWGNSGWETNPAKDSFIQAFTVEGGWGEDTLTWNNAPQALRRVAATRVSPLAEFPGWPGIPYTWTVTEAVAEAYAAGEDLNLALYSADTDFHSSKYFTSSEAEDWNAEGRPTLTVVWGRPAELPYKAMVPLVLRASEEAGGANPRTVSPSPH